MKNKPLYVALAAFTLAASVRAEEPNSFNVTVAMKSAGLLMDVKKREVRLEASVCRRHGILEYLVCRPKTFEHESVFTTKCVPSMLHLSLLAIGLEPCEFGDDEEWKTKKENVDKCRVQIEIEYEQNGKMIRHDISSCLSVRIRKKAETSLAWIFTGSYFADRDDKQVYAADSAGGVIGLGLDGASVLQIEVHAGNPHQNKELGMKINPENLPAVGTLVYLVFTPYLEKGSQANDDPLPSN